MASLISRIASVFKSEKRTAYVGPTNGLGLPYGYTPYPISQLLAMQLSVVYRCVDVISDAIGTQLWERLNYENGGWENDPMDPIIYMMNNDPDSVMSRFTFMKLLVSKALLEGYSCAIINRPYPMADPESFTLVTDTIKIFIRPDRTLYYKVGQPGKEIFVDGDDMIHLLNYTYDGINGVSTLTHAANTITLSYASESSAKGFFTSGANMSGILQVEGKLTKEKATDIKSSWANAFNITSGNPGGIAVMEAGMTFIPVTVNPKDAQMLETRKYNAVDICRFFGVHPSKVFDSENLTYSNIESFQLGFITDTIAPWDAKIEAEFNRKLLRPSKRIASKFNLSVDELYKANLDTMANYYQKMFAIGGFTVNEIRTKIRNKVMDNGDKAYVPLNLVSIDTPVTQNKKIDKNLNVDQNGSNGDTGNTK